MRPDDHIHIKRSMFVLTEITKEICVKYIVNGEIPIQAYVEFCGAETCPPPLRAL
jgi:hypothetical protein